MREIKRRFFAMRNGIVADTLRRAGSPYRIIFGLNMPQIAEIAREHGPDTELALQLWANTSTRCSRLIAPMLVRAEDVPDRQLMEIWIGGLLDDGQPMPGALEGAMAGADTEVADNVCHRLIRNRRDAPDIACRLSKSPRTIERYASLRLFYGMAAQIPAKALRAAENALQSEATLLRPLATLLRDEASYWLGETK